MNKSILTKIFPAVIGIVMISNLFSPSLANAQLGSVAGGALGGWVTCKLGGILGGLTSSLGGMLGGVTGGLTGGITGGIIGGSSAVPVSDKDTHKYTEETSKNTEFKKTQACTLDGLVWSLAGDILQGMTTEIVNWINGDGKRPPSFISDPGSFFANQANDIANEFLATSGPLKMLCGNFGLDIKLSLAMNQADTVYKKRYTCTLQSIINNASNAHASVSVGTSPNGTTLGGLMNGSVLNNANGLSVNGVSANTAGQVVSDTFTKEGGWLGFLALTTSPQNNPVGSYLMARSDLQQSIAAKREQTNNDLNRGNGFLSYTKCEPDEAEMNGQKCSVVTPGSVIVSALNKQLGAGADRLNAAHSINEIVGALFQKLMTTVLKEGLSTVSTTRSGQRSSILSQLSTQTTQANQVNTKATMKEMASSTSQYLRPAIDYKYFTNQTFTLLQTEQQLIASMQNDCINNGNGSQEVVGAIQVFMDESVTPVVDESQKVAEDADARLEAINSLQAAVQANDVQSAGSIYSQIVGNNYLVTLTDLSNANSNLTKAPQVVNSWNSSAMSYQLQCGLSIASSTEM